MYQPQPRTFDNRCTLLFLLLCLSLLLWFWLLFFPIITNIYRVPNLRISICHWTINGRMDLYNILFNFIYFYLHLFLSICVLQLSEGQEQGFYMMRLEFEKDQDYSPQNLKLLPSIVGSICMGKPNIDDHLGRILQKSITSFWILETSMPLAI